MNWEMWDWLIGAFLVGILVAVIVLWFQEYFIFKPLSRKKRKENISKFLKRHK